MALKKPTDDEFEAKDYAVKHKPTGARWWWKYPGSQSDDLGYNAGHLGSVLPNGDDYDIGAVKEIAARLLASVRK